MEEKKATPLNDYSFTPIREEASDSDLLEDETHQKTASSLKSFISHSDKGMTIGLEGAWGSGKSTVINLLRKELDRKSEQTIFFAFDAWAHDGDPLRKIFLESLITTIDPEATDEYLQDLREKVSDRKKTIKVNTKKSASKLGKRLSASALTIPIGAALLSAVNYENLFWPFSDGAGSLHLTFLFGLLLSVTPLLVIFFWWLCGDKNSDTGKREWDIFEAHSDETYSQDITEDGERTSIEFEKFFNQIVNYLFSNKSDYKYNKLIIVIDNLDRVDANYAQNIWSTLQTFFQHRSSYIGAKDRAWADKIWFLIPYDRYGLRRAWLDDRSFSEEEDDDDSKFQLAESFMQKCFQVISEVPTPAISTWIKYFRTCAHRHLSGWPQARCEEFVEAYIRCKSKLDESPSPREMHSHINRAGMLALHWKDEFSAESINLYALYKKLWTNEELRAELLKEGLPRGYPCIRSAITVKKEVAGLMFGVNPDKGMQLLLTPEITSAISKGDDTELSKLEEAHKDAFWVSLRACQEKWLISPSHNDAYKLNVVTALALAFDKAKPRIREFIKPLEEAFLNSAEAWNLNDYEYHNALHALLELSTDRESLLTQLYARITKRCKNVISEINDKGISEGELIQWREFEKLLELNGKPITPTYYPKLDLNNWQNWMNQCKSAGIMLKSILPSKAALKQLVNDTRFHQHQIDKEKLELLSDTLDLTPNKKVWPDLHEALITWFNIGTREVDADHAYKFAIKLYGISSQSDKKRLEECISEQPFWARGVHSRISTNPSLPFLTAICCKNYEDIKHISEEVKQYLSGELDENEVELALSYFKQAKALEHLWCLAGNKEKLFAKQVIQSTEESILFKYGGMWFDEIQWEDENEVSRITKKLCANGAINKVLENIAESPNAYHRTISLLLNYGDNESIEFCSKLLSALSREQWLEALQKSNLLLSHVPESSSTFSKAWSDFLKALASGKQDKPTENEFIEVIKLRAKVLDLNSIHEPEVLRAYYEKPDQDELSDHEFELLSGIFSQHLKEVSQNSIERRISLWLETNNLSRIRWFLEAKYSVKDDPTEDIVASVRQGLDSDDAEVVAICSELNKKLDLGIQIEETPASKDKKNSNKEKSNKT